MREEHQRLRRFNPKISDRIARQSHFKLQRKDSAVHEPQNFCAGDRILLDEHPDAFEGCVRRREQIEHPIIH